MKKKIQISVWHYVHMTMIVVVLYATVLYAAWNSVIYVGEEAASLW